MPFIKRHLTSEEWSLLDFAAYGVIERRIPPIEREWAIDSERAVMCTQLTSDTAEMREGEYWYLLIVSRKAFIFAVDAFRLQKQLFRKSRREAFLYKSGIPASEIATIEQLASEAHCAVSHLGEELVFTQSHHFPSVP